VLLLNVCLFLLLLLFISLWLSPETFGYTLLDYRVYYRRLGGTFWTFFTIDPEEVLSETFLLLVFLDTVQLYLEYDAVLSSDIVYSWSGLLSVWTSLSSQISFPFAADIKLSFSNFQELRWGIGISDNSSGCLIHGLICCPKAFCWFPSSPLGVL
jgi:hypothetical protein